MGMRAEGKQREAGVAPGDISTSLLINKCGVKHAVRNNGVLVVP